MTFGEVAQMFRHLKQRGVALLSGAQDDYLAGVFPRPHSGVLPVVEEDRCRVDLLARGCPLA